MLNFLIIDDLAVLASRNKLLLAKSENEERAHWRNKVTIGVLSLNLSLILTFGLTVFSTARRYFDMNERGELVFVILITRGWFGHSFEITTPCL